MKEARKEVGEIIDRLAVIYDEEDVNSPVARSHRLFVVFIVTQLF